MTKADVLVIGAGPEGMAAPRRARVQVIGGVDLSVIEGEIEGYGACRETARARRLFGKRDSARGFATALERAFALGMGACQGRICGAATEFLFGWKADSARPPLLSARAGSLLLKEEGSITQ